MALLNDVLDLSKIEAGKFDIVRADLDLVHTLRRLHRLWKPKAEEKGLEFDSRSTPTCPPVLNFDAVRVRQCVSNLVSNAIKFTHEGRVEFRSSRRAKQHGGQYLVSIRVSDTGVGHGRQETPGRLFQPFAQADESISRKYGGTGLGLVDHPAPRRTDGRRRHGRQRARPRLEFHLHLPRRAGRCPAAQGQEASRRACRGSASALTGNRDHARILLVDDHPINRQVASLLLRPFNMRIVEAVNGKEALEALSGESRSTWSCSTSTCR